MSKVLYIIDHITKDEVNTSVAHVASLGAVFLVLVKILPVIATVMPIVWYSIVIFESKTVQTWMNARRSKRRRKHLAAARAARLKRAQAVTATNLKEHAHDHPRPY